MPYSATLMDHFQNPRNAGEMESPDAVGQAGTLGAGEFAVIYLRLDGSCIAEARFQTFGCGPAIAACSALTEWAIGKGVEQATAIDAAGVAELLGGLPEDKLFCAQLAVDALRDALSGA